MFTLFVDLTQQKKNTRHMMHITYNEVDGNHWVQQPRNTRKYIHMIDNNVERLIFHDKAPLPHASS